MFLFQLRTLFFTRPQHRSWIPLFWRIGTFFLLAAENEEGFFVATCGTIAGIRDTISFTNTAIDRKDFLSDIPVITALDKAGSQYLRTDFRRDARRFLKEFVKCLISNVTSRSLIEQGVSCFCSAMVISGVDAAPFQLLNKFLERLLEKS